MKTPPGVTVDDRGQVFIQGTHIGTYHRVNSSYPPSVTTLKGKLIGAATDIEALNALVAAAQTEHLGIDLDGNLFPDETWILRINSIAMRCDPNPAVKPNIIAKVHFNTHNSTGSSAQAKAASYKIMEIDLEKNTFFSGTKEYKFTNQEVMLGKLKAHIDGVANGKPEEKDPDDDVDCGSGF
jgi:hypothetical protein